MKGHIFKSSLAILVVALCVKVMAGQQVYPPELLAYADTVLYNGKILTADDQFTMAQAVAIRDGKFLAVGANSAIRPLIGPDTEVIDLGGKTAIPGIINTHLHLADNAVRPIQWWRNDQEVLEGLKEQVPAVPEGQWVVRWFNSVVQGRIRGKLSKAQLDAIAPRHPLAVGSHTGGYYVLNSLAFQSLNLAEDLEGIGKDPQSGQPNGEVSGQAARYVGVQIGWVEPFEEKIDSLRRVIDG
ncbi:MAG: amidohydrolase family protein, partial [Acidobacteria bacterium]|nr:amidohydrolase family protein [Acidobacteriota bacterium]